MCPILRLGPFVLGTNGLMMAAAFVLGWLVARRTCRHRGWDPDPVLTVFVSAAIPGIAAAHLLHVLDHWPTYQGDLWKLLSIKSGSGWYGGLLLAVFFAWLWCRHYGVALRSALDASAPVLALGYALCRIGCLLAGDGCYGVPVEPPWEWLGVAFPRGLAPTTVEVHPTPLYEALFHLGLFAVLYLLDARRVVARGWPRGRLFALFVLFHCGARLLVEFLRLNPRYWVSAEGLVKISPEDHFAGQFGLSSAQWISIAGILLASAGLLFARVRGARAVRA